MAPTRAAFAALALGALSVATPASAQVGRRALATYPLARGGPAGDAAADVQSLLDAALYRAAQRSDDVVLATPHVTRAACGSPSTATAQCLAGLAAGGLVVRATVQKSDGLLVIAMDAVDASARTYGPMTVHVDAFAQSAEPLVHAVLVLVEQSLRAPRADLRAQATPPPAPAAKPSAAKPVVPLPPPPVPKPAAPVAQVERGSAKGRGWYAIGPWLAGTGAALLAGAVTVSVVNHRTSDDLERRFRAGTLGPADLASYRRVERNNRLSRILFASGGALTLSGIAIWTAEPARRSVLAGVAGRF
jgi:hypothetical protein